MTICVLMVEDETAIRDMVRFALQSEGYRLLEAGDAMQAQDLLLQQTPDLILLDWMLPGRSGVEFARHLRRDARWRAIPLIMLTARRDEDDKVQGLEAGADDYITKPFSVRELKARMQALLRRSAQERGDEVLVVDALALDEAGHRITIGGEAVKLGPTEFRLLQFFMQHVDRVFSREQLLDNVWGKDIYVDERTVDVHIRRLRKGLEPFGYDRYIQTVRSVGYRFSRTEH
ncbi:MAG: phosphate regulon transcriptional regulator PhoB [Gammaproteobacteria bacterium]|nr:phosphate regulon transcriptional regulator PhoB [Gammaproteobacteria bacterium]